MKSILASEALESCNWHGNIECCSCLGTHLGVAQKWYGLQWMNKNPEFGGIHLSWDISSKTVNRMGKFESYLMFKVAVVTDIRLNHTCLETLVDVQEKR